MISPGTNVGRLLDERPELVEFLAGYHAHFARLRNRLLRRVVAPRVTVADAARMAGIPCDELVAALRRAVGEPEAGAGEPAASPAPATAGPRPAVLDALRPVELDVREDLRAGREPFARIMGAARALAPGEALLLRAPFEPVPLYEVLGRRGLAHWSEARGPDDWQVWFHRVAPGPEAGGERAPARPPGTPDAGPERVVVDVRGLEPPQPMVRVLELLDTLPARGVLEVLHDRRPLFLYPQLEARGFAHATDEPEPGLVRILIRHAGGGDAAR